MDKIKEKSKNITKNSSVRGLEYEYVSHAGKGLDKNLFTKEPGINVLTLYDIVKKSPEISACIHAIIEDIMADSWRFVGSKNAIKKAEEFQITSRLYKVLTNAIMDLLITGDAYILKLSVSEDKLKSLCEKISGKVAKTMGVTIAKDTVYELVKQDIKSPKDVQLLKSSTMKINFDSTGRVVTYEQEVNAEKRIYAAKDVIHLSLTNIGGQPYGFTPIESGAADVATLIFAKEFAGKYFENDGIPYFIFKMLENQPDDRAYKLLVQELKNLKKEESKYRSMVLTGNVEVQQVNKFNKDMEFSKLIQHFTQIVLMMMGVPAHRVNMGTDSKEIGGSVNRAYEGYYKKISFMQKIIENSLNYELWDPFNVEMVFNRVYKIDEMREAQVVQILAQAGLVTIEEAREMMGMEPEMPEGQTPISISDKFSPDFKGDKKEQQGQANNGKADNTQDNKTKTIMKSFNDSLEIGYVDFVKVVESKSGPGNFDKANVLYIETDTKFILFFSDGNWKYKTEIIKTQIEVEKFRLEKLRNAVKISI